MTNKLLPAKIILVLIIFISFGTVLGVLGYLLSLPKPITYKPTATPTSSPKEEVFGGQKLPFELTNLMLKDVTADYAPDYKPCGDKGFSIKDYDGEVKYEDLNNDNIKEIFIVAESFCGESLAGSGSIFRYLYTKNWMGTGLI